MVEIEGREGIRTQLSISPFKDLSDRVNNCKERVKRKKERGGRVREREKEGSREMENTG